MGPSSGATPLHNLTVSRRQDSRSDGVPSSARPMPEWQISSSGNANTTFRNIALSPLQGFHPDLRQGGGNEARGVKIRQSVPSSQRSLRRSRHLQYHALTNSLASISSAFWFAAGFAHGAATRGCKRFVRPLTVSGPLPFQLPTIFLICGAVTFDQKLNRKSLL